MLNSFGLGINLNVNSNATNKFGHIGNAYFKMKNMFAGGNAKIGSMFSLLGKSINLPIVNIISNFSQFGSKILQTTGMFGPFAIGVGVAAFALSSLSKKIKAAIEDASLLQKEMADVATLLDGDYSRRIQELTGNIENQQIEFGQSADVMSKGLYELISAYGDSSETVKILDINTRAAAAGKAELLDTVKLLSAVTKGYGDITAEAQKQVSDFAFTTVKLGQTTFPELATSMGKVVPLASTLKVKQQELFAQYATLTGVTGNAAEVSTQIASMLGAFIKPSRELTEVVKGLGYESAIAMVKEKGLYGSLEILQKVTKGNEEAFGKLLVRKEGLTAAFALLGAQADKFKSKYKAMMTESVGATDRAFAKIAETRDFAKKQAEQADKVFSQKLGRLFLPASTSWLKFRTFLTIESIKLLDRFNVSFAQPLANTFSPFFIFVGGGFKLLYGGLMWLVRAGMVVNGIIIKKILLPFRIVGAFFTGFINGVTKGVGDIKQEIDRFKMAWRPVTDEITKVHNAIDKAFGIKEGGGINLMKGLAKVITLFVIPPFKLIVWIISLATLGVTKLIAGIAGIASKFKDRVQPFFEGFVKVIKKIFYPILQVMEYVGAVEKGTAESFMNAGFDNKDKPPVPTGKETKIQKLKNGKDENDKLLSDEDLDKLYDAVFKGSKDGTKEGNKDRKDIQGGWEYDFLIRNFIPVR